MAVTWRRAPPREDKKYSSEWRCWSAPLDYEAIRVTSGKVSNKCNSCRELRPWIGLWKSTPFLVLDDSPSCAQCTDGKHHALKANRGQTIHCKIACPGQASENQLLGIGASEVPLHLLLYRMCNSEIEMGLSKRLAPPQRTKKWR